MIDELILRDRESKKRIAVIGDPMDDRWLIGKMDICQDGMRFVHLSDESTPGGAANAARQLSRWNCAAIEYYPQPPWCIKTRFMVDGKIVLRVDRDIPYYRPENARREAIRAALEVNAVLLCDYDKGFLDPQTIRQIIDLCNEREIPVVADAKRKPGLFSGAILKCNVGYAGHCDVTAHSPAAVVTCGEEYPFLTGETAFDPHEFFKKPRSVVCQNHVGAGDCFSAHLALALAHGITLEDAAKIAHAAGRVYVQYPFSRPPWPHEIRKDLNPTGGKIIGLATLPALRQSIPGRIVFSNGVFRIPHAGHSWLLQWAKQQGDVLVAGINSDDSAAALRHGQFVLPFNERAAILSAQESVDWIVPIPSSPADAIATLKPDCLVKGSEYKDTCVPGSEFCKDVRIAPESPFPRHSSDFPIRE